MYQVDKMSLEDTKEKLEWSKRVFEYKQNNSYEIKNRNYVMCIHKNEVKNIAEWNLLYNIINSPKRAKKLNSHYSPILHRCMITRKGKAKLKNFCILLESGCSSMIVMGRLVNKLSLEKCVPMQWHMQDRNITTNIKIKIDFTLPKLRATNVVTWECHVDW